MTKLVNVINTLTLVILVSACSSGSITRLRSRHAADKLQTKIHHSTKCRVVPLSGRKRLTADVIVSAYVQSFYLPGRAGTPFSGRVRVDRVFRGSPGLQGRTVLIEGLGDAKICASTPRLGDTKLFFLDTIDSTRYRLHSSILRSNLKNHRILGSLIKETVCSRECRFDAACVEGRCACTFNCSNHHAPICAVDGRTYKNKCSLKLEECKNQKSIAPVHYGMCSSQYEVSAPRTSGLRSKHFSDAKYNQTKPGKVRGTSDCPDGTWTGTSGCRPCLCSTVGAVDNVCDKLTGQCRCYQGYVGHICDVCQGGRVNGTCREAREVGYMADTSVHVFGTLGNICMRNRDCTAVNSECKSSVCVCKAGYKEDSPLSCSVDLPGPCTFSPCTDGGTCVETGLQFTCICRNGRTGRYCEQIAEKIIKEASFSGKSFLTLAYLPKSITRTDLKVELKPYSADGLILLARFSKHKYGDFISVCLRKGHLEVRFDLGSGAIKMKSVGKVNLSTWNQVIVRRYRQDAMLKLNSDEPVNIRSSGRSKSLNVRDEAYVGGIPGANSTLHKIIAGTRKNYQGCMRRLEIQGREVELGSDSLIQSSTRVSACSAHPCSRLRCRNGGTCSVRRNRGGARCSCPPGFRGRRCHKQQKRRRNAKRRRRRMKKYKYDVSRRYI